MDVTKKTVLLPASGPDEHVFRGGEKEKEEFLKMMTMVVVCVMRWIKSLVSPFIKGVLPFHLHLQLLSFTRFSLSENVNGGFAMRTMCQQHSTNLSSKNCLGYIRAVLICLL